VTFHQAPNTAAVNRSNAETSPVQLENAKIEFREGFPQDPSIDLKFGGSAIENDFSAYAIGTLQHPMHFFVFDPPLTEKIILAELAGGRPANARDDTPPGLLLPAQLYDGVEVVDWAAIPTPANEPANPPPPAPAQ
jgi:hypothetical protein